MAVPNRSSKVKKIIGRHLRSNFIWDFPNRMWQPFGKRSGSATSPGLVSRKAGFLHFRGNWRVLHGDIHLIIADRDRVGQEWESFDSLKQLAEFANSRVIA